MATLADVIGQNLRRIREGREERQEDVAKRARVGGLKWTRATVAAVETGARTMSLAELVLLAHVLLVPVQRFLEGDGWVELAPGAEATRKGIRTMLGDPDAAMNMPIGRNFRTPATRNLDAAFAGLKDRLLHVKEIAERYGMGATTLADSAWWEDAATDEAERKAARKLGVDPLEVVVASASRWGRSLTAERDRRVAGLVDESTAPRTIQSVRGHVTRALLAELSTILTEKGNTDGEH